VKKNEGLPLVLCGAKSKRTGKSCRQPAMKNGKCRLHGGKSSGPKTRKGRDRIKIANTKHGLYRRASISERKFIRELLLKGENSLIEIKNHY